MDDILSQASNSAVYLPIVFFKIECFFNGNVPNGFLDEEWRGTESTLLKVLCEVSTVCDDLGCHVICWCWSTGFSEVQGQQGNLPVNFRALHASLCSQAL
ncbi:hypothetical protein AMECASPLE_024244 [Ameca splendens]|uniref:Uncharacterized protein n=1 Tax=Ameca splendens TaxID=208324 RepID=A0ABV0ZFN2_9TELE